MTRWLGILLIALACRKLISGVSGLSGLSGIFGDGNGALPSNGLVDINAIGIVDVNAVQIVSV